VGRPARCKFRTLPSWGPLRERNGRKERIGVVTASDDRTAISAQPTSNGQEFSENWPGAFLAPLQLFNFTPLEWLCAAGSQSRCSLSVPCIATGSGGRRRSGTWLLTIQSIDHAAEGFARVNDAQASGIPAQFGFR